MIARRPTSLTHRVLRVALIAGVVLVCRTVRSGWPALLAPAVGLSLATLLAMGDLATGRIPNRQVTFALGAGGALMAISAVAFGSVDLLTRSLLAALIAGVPWFAVAFATSNRGVGGGDVKLAALLGLSLGQIDLLAVEIQLALALLTWVALALTTRRRRRDRFVFGPALVGSAIAAVVVCAILQRSGVVLDIQRLHR
jgi:leader peptidase (prepilin peptidase) / N-methyltransferase